VALIAGIGILINGLSAFILLKQQNDINMKAAYLHMLTDTLVSLGVLITGLAIRFYPYPWLDPLVSILIGIIILIASVRLLKRSLTLTLDGVPEGVSLMQVEELARLDRRILDIHHIHIWPLSSTRNAMTAHVTVDEKVNKEETEEIKQKLKSKLVEFQINHATLEIEFGNKIDCDHEDC
jgi:cobalt-zinc-cadmium efflux system protein